MTSATEHATEARELLFDVMATAYERINVMMTTGLTFENWTEILGAEQLTRGTLDQLTHRCKIIQKKERPSGSRMPRGG
jgi:DNA replication protein DnaC